MVEVLVTRSGQITLTKDVREKMHIDEGDVVIVNVLGNTAVVTKKNPQAFEKSNFLPENFSKTLREMRSFSWEGRLKRLGIVP